MPLDPHPRSRTLILTSGGLDSLLVWHLSGRPTRVHFRIGTATNAVENPEAEIVEQLDMRSGELPDGHLPLRNMVMALRAAQICVRGQVLIGQVLEWTNDLNRGAYRALNRVIRKTSDLRVEVRAPFAWTPRWTAMRLALETGLAGDEVYATVSCIKGQRPGCGTCGSCMHRAMTMISCGLQPDVLTIPTFDQFVNREWRREGLRRALRKLSFQAAYAAACEVVQARRVLR